MPTHLNKFLKVINACEEKILIRYCCIAARRMAEAMTSEEKAKLYDAIGYEEGMTIAEYPVSFVERKIEIHLSKTQLSILDNDQPVKLITKFCCFNVFLGLEQRPSADGLQ